MCNKMAGRHGNKGIKNRGGRRLPVTTRWYASRYYFESFGRGIENELGANIGNPFGAGSSDRVE